MLCNIACNGLPLGAVGAKQAKLITTKKQSL